MPELNFDRLHQFFCKVPSVQQARVDSYGSDGQHAWWFKFQIEVEHPLAWQTVQELGHVLNYISRDERLPTQFLPVSPPPYMNGDAKDFLSSFSKNPSLNKRDFARNITSDQKLKVRMSINHSTP